MGYVLVMWDECRVGGRAWEELRRSVMCASRLSEMALRAMVSPVLLGLLSKAYRFRRIHIMLSSCDVVWSLYW